MSSRVETTRAAIAAGALEEFALLGYQRSSMDSAARRAGVSRATLYLHFGSKEDLLRAVVSGLHDEHLTLMQAAAEAPTGDFQQRLLAVLQARFGRWVELTSASPHGAELYDLHDRLCGDIARASQERSERVLAKLVREAARRGEIDLQRLGLSAPKVAGVLFDCAHGAKGEDPAHITPALFTARLTRIVKVLAAGLRA